MRRPTSSRSRSPRWAAGGGNIDGISGEGQLAKVRRSPNESTPCRNGRVERKSRRTRDGPRGSARRGMVERRRAGELRAKERGRERDESVRAQVRFREEGEDERRRTRTVAASRRREGGPAAAPAQARRGRWRRPDLDLEVESCYDEAKEAVELKPANPRRGSRVCSARAVERRHVRELRAREGRVSMSVGASATSRREKGERTMTVAAPCRKEEGPAEPALHDDDDLGAVEWGTEYCSWYTT